MKIDQHPRCGAPYVRPDWDPMGPEYVGTCTLRAGHTDNHGAYLKLAKRGPIVLGREKGEEESRWVRWENR